MQLITIELRHLSELIRKWWVLVIVEEVLILGQSKDLA